MAKTGSSTVNKSAKDGKFVTKEKVSGSPATTYKQTVTKGGGKK